MTLRCYVAASSHPDERARVLRAFAAVREVGAELALDWLATWRPTAELTGMQRWEAARDDAWAIRTADVVWLLASPHRSDALVEYGIALAESQASPECKPLLIVSGDVTCRGIFAAMAHHEHDTDAGALEAIRVWAREVRG